MSNRESAEQWNPPNEPDEIGIALSHQQSHSTIRIEHCSVTCPLKLSTCGQFWLGKHEERFDRL